MCYINLFIHSFVLYILNYDEMETTAVECRPMLEIFVCVGWYSMLSDG